MIQLKMKLENLEKIQIRAQSVRNGIYATFNRRQRVFITINSITKELTIAFINPFTFDLTVALFETTKRTSCLRCSIQIFQLY